MAGHERLVGRRRWALAALVGYLLVGGWLVFGPAPGDEAEAVEETVREARSVVRGSGVEESAADQSRTGDVLLGMDDDELSNVLLFVPLPVVAAIGWRRRWWVAVPAGVMASGAIELAQFVALSHRSPQWSDVFFNSVGVLVGAALVVLVIGCVRTATAARRRTERDAGHAVS